MPSRRLLHKGTSTSDKLGSMRRNVLNITASDVKDAKLTATVTIPAADVDAAIKKAYKDTAKKYRFPGFRAGKAPRPVIDSALGAEATLAQATNDLIAANEPAVLNELDIVPTKSGDYKELDLAKDHEDYTYTVEFSCVLPLSSLLLRRCRDRDAPCGGHRVRDQQSGRDAPQLPCHLRGCRGSRRRGRGLRHRRPQGRRERRQLCRRGPHAHRR